MVWCHGRGISPLKVQSQALHRPGLEAWNTFFRRVENLADIMRVIEPDLDVGCKYAAMGTLDY